MNFLHYSTKMLQNASPAGLLLGGTVLFASLPLIRKGLRCAAVLTARAVYSVTTEARNIKDQALHAEEEITS
jgi:hypothetical protein